MCSAAQHTRVAASEGEWTSNDGFHPSPEGYQKLADLTHEALRRAGWLPPATSQARP